MSSAADLALAATDDELLLRYKDLDDRAAFSALYDRYWADMFAYACLQLPRGGQAAEDMVQEAFLEFVEHHKSYSPGGVRALLYLIVKRCCTRHHRRARAAKRGFGRTVVLGHRNDPGDPQAAPEQIDAQIDARDLLGVLTPKQEAALRLTRLEQHTAESAAIQLGVTAAAIPKLVARAIQRLKRAVTPDEQNGRGGHREDNS
jgi:RNA polymerase sigma factor (sigma-70 family)